MLRHPKQRKRSFAHNWLAEKVFNRKLWVPERHSFMNGLALGMLVSMLPPFTPQMAISALVCISRGWNVPISMACCWISNILTHVPQLYFQILLGLWFLEYFVPGGGKAGVAFDKLEGIWQIWREHGGLAAFQAFQPETFDILGPLALPWAIGILVSGILLSASSWLLGHALWSVFAHRVPVKHPVPHRSQPIK